MRYLWTFFIFFCYVAFAFASQSQPTPLPPQACEIQAPYGWPKLQKSLHSAFICRNGYATFNDLDAKVSPWEVYTLLPQHTIGCVPRSNAFAADQSLPANQRATPNDYLHSGYDIGHMVNDADESWSPVVEHESFILTNMEPQLPALNRGIWKQLETMVRVWSWQYNHPLTIYVGGIYNISSDPTIGPNHVTVPHLFYKIVIDDVTKQSYAWIFPNRTPLSTDMNQFQVTVNDVEKYTDIFFPTPDSKNIKNIVPQTNYSAFLHAKTSTCGR